MGKKDQVRQLTVSPFRSAQPKGKQKLKADVDIQVTSLGEIISDLITLSLPHDHVKIQDVENMRQLIHCIHSEVADQDEDCCSSHVIFPSCTAQNLRTTYSATQSSCVFPS